MFANMIVIAFVKKASKKNNNETEQDLRSSLSRP